MEEFLIVSWWGGASPAENFSFLGLCHKLTLFMYACCMFPLSESLKNKGK